HAAGRPVRMRRAGPEGLMAGIDKNTTRPILADWSPQVWRWRPQHGRWSPHHGRPCDPVFVRVTTDGVAPHHSYEFWRETALYNFDIDRLSRARRGGFSARVSGVIGEQAEFYAYASDAISGHQSRHRQTTDQIDLGLVAAGQRIHRLTDGNIIVADAGQLFCFDATQPAHAAWSAHRGAHLSLSRRAVEQTLGDPVPPLATLMQVLAASRLAPVLRDQMTLLARHVNHLNAVERAELLEQTERLALLTLASLRSIGGSACAEPLDPVGLFTAARRYIEAHFMEPDLQVNRVARALGCSRATLYRAFAEQECTVAGMIRELRLLRARRLLARAPAHARIDDIAARCGFSEPRT